MHRILQSEAAAKLPVDELIEELHGFVEPLTARLPEKRLRDVGVLAVQGILGAQSPMVTEIAGALVREDETVRPMAKRLYRFLWNERFSHRTLEGIIWHRAACRCRTRVITSSRGFRPRQLREALH